MTDEQDITIGDLADFLKPGETIRMGGLELTRWAEGPAASPPAAPNRATRRGNRLHPRSAKDLPDHRPGTERPY